MKLDKAAVARIKNATPKKQKGASSLEYVVLAAVIVAIVGTVFYTGLGTDLADYVKTEIFDKITAPDPA